MNWNRLPNLSLFFWDVKPSWQSGFVCFGDFADATIITIQLGNTQLFFLPTRNPYARSRLGNGENSCAKIMCISLLFSLCCAFVSFSVNWKTWFSTFSMGSIYPISVSTREFRFFSRGKTVKNVQIIGHIFTVSFIILFLAEVFLLPSTR